MPQISRVKKDKISEQILHYLFTISPGSCFTVDISREIARDEEFVKDLLLELKKKSLIVEVNKNKDGKTYLKRQRWRLSNEIYDIYNRQQTKSSLVSQQYLY